MPLPTCEALPLAAAEPHEKSKPASIPVISLLIGLASTCTANSNRTSRQRAARQKTSVQIRWSGDASRVGGECQRANRVPSLARCPTTTRLLPIASAPITTALSRTELTVTPRLRVGLPGWPSEGKQQMRVKHASIVFAHPLPHVGFCYRTARVSNGHANSYDAMFNEKGEWGKRPKPFSRVPARKTLR